MSEEKKIGGRAFGETLNVEKIIEEKVALIRKQVGDGKELLAESEDKIPELTDRIETLIITGTNPATESIKLIDKGGYDLMVIGSRGLSGIKAYLGSVSNKVLNGSSISVLVAK